MEFEDKVVDLLEQVLEELQDVNRNLTARSTSDRLNEEMDLVK